ncbi:unnamed protein product [Didymodactylos carnosus]|uniref:Uncharacterized protein n=1 Tax=Didymodactylos carnosus TaxID=1234261 RepID=A0A8S2GP34_9BILA|nr:unnamed protein product [Didymodactylos carnosus]CAF3523848.1 unnamed protein product [Didymodactylos carnosus]
MEAFIQYGVPFLASGISALAIITSVLLGVWIDARRRYPKVKRFWYEVEKSNDPNLLSQPISLSTEIGEIIAQKNEPIFAKMRVMHERQILDRTQIKEIKPYFQLAKEEKTTSLPADEAFLFAKIVEHEFPRELIGFGSYSQELFIPLTLAKMTERYYRHI